MASNVFNKTPATEAQVNADDFWRRVQDKISFAKLQKLMGYPDNSRIMSMRKMRHTIPDALEVLKIAEILGVTPSWLMYGTDFLSTDQLSVDEMRVVTAMRKSDKLKGVFLSLADGIL